MASMSEDEITRAIIFGFVLESHCTDARANFCTLEFRSVLRDIIWCCCRSCRGHKARYLHTGLEDLNWVI